MPLLGRLRSSADQDTAKSCNAGTTIVLVNSKHLAHSATECRPPLHSDRWHTYLSAASRRRDKHSRPDQREEHSGFYHRSNREVPLGLQQTHSHNAHQTGKPAVYSDSCDPTYSLDHPQP